MKADPAGVMTGSYYMDGDHACSEGALAAGCRFLAGYPITPSTEVAERIAQRFPKIGGVFIQMEDELGSMAAVVGAAWGGKKSLSVSSGPGVSLMLENIGLAAMMEVPCVIVNVQRGGPSTGLPTKVGQADVMQARWGSHGDYEIIAVSPESPQEAFELTIEAFNFAEIYRVPVFVLLDECVGHMTERVVIPEADEIEVVPRTLTKKAPGEYLPYELNGGMVPEMVAAGQGHRFHTTGLTHDERGYPDMTVETQDKLVRRLSAKILDNTDDIVMIEEDGVDDADVIIVAYGITSRVARAAVTQARAEGIKAGLFRMKTVWPFPVNRVRELAASAKGFVVPEVNLGQISLEVERVIGGQALMIPVTHAGGDVHEPEDILVAVREVMK
jgi:2-oxoglutarate/2-oxoacid ferredoxin oxidoreductase subunit alpha